METKTITVDGMGRVKLSNDAGLDKWLRAVGIQCLLDDDGINIIQFELLEDGGKYRPQRHDAPEDDTKQKRQRNFTTLLLSGDVKSATKELIEAAQPFIGESWDVPKNYRVPATSLSGTWHGDQMKMQLRSLREEIRPKLQTYAPLDRQGVVVGIRLGTGNGKTHALTEAPEWLDALGIYLTYNLEQDLSVDQRYPEAAMLIRLTLSLHGCGSVQCTQFLKGAGTELFLGIPPKLLRGLFVSNAKDRATGDIAICVDEIRELGDHGAKAVISELSAVAALYLAETKSMCTVLVSSLVSSTFQTHNGRTALDWAPDRPDSDTLDYFSNLVLPKEKEKILSLVNAVSGAHMRSIVVAFSLCLKDHLEPSVKALCNKMKGRLGAKLSTETNKGICTFVRQSIAAEDPDTVKCSPDIEAVIDRRGVVPPVFLMHAFESGSRAGAGKYVENLLCSFSLFDGGAGKQLENVAKHYDLFRAFLGLPVVPGQVEVTVPGLGGKHATWYKQLLFSTEEMSLNEKPLLRQKGKAVVATGHIPQRGYYYHPQISNHPWIDRAYVAQHPRDSRCCLVLSQDKVNASNFPGACRKLNIAADELMQVSQDFESALLVVNVIGAGEDTRSQSELKWPHILIRGRREVESFYTEHFADMVWFARQRHLLSLES